MSKARDAILGLVVGDALGVPVEFQPRDYLKKHPVKDMTGYGTYNQSPGTWSDDSSLALCLADELTRGFDLQRIANSFVQWLYHNHWTPHGRVFDVGNNTEAALRRLKDGASPEQSGSTGENANGNGSLMRILPLLFYVKDIPDQLERYETIRKVSAITHAHVRSTLSCYYYLEFADFLLREEPPRAAYSHANERFMNLTHALAADPEEASHFNRLTGGDIDKLEETEIESGTYVVHTLEAAIWSILNTSDYPEAVLKAVNLGYDTDTTAAVTGGLAGLIYQAKAIPQPWLDPVARLGEIETVIEKLSNRYES
jgi:ADP-ribosylglycohydrolase